MSVNHPPEAASAEGFLVQAGLMAATERSRWTALTGGVSSDLWRVDLPGRTLCVKSALAQLRVADTWLAPVSRNAVEHAWLQFANRVCPDNAPQVLAHDPPLGFFAMQFLPPEDHPVWKAELLRGAVDPAFAAHVGEVLGVLHSASTRDPTAATTFATDENFEALRLHPYLRVTADRNPGVGDRLRGLADRTAATRRAVVHGDLSPKNILVGPRGPVVLDAECAWFGDPAFDVAFCLTHLALKMLVVPEARAALRQSGLALVDSYAAHVDWEGVAELTGRAGELLPALLLARVDGASPVEYLTVERSRNHVRMWATAGLLRPARSVIDVFTAWADDLDAGVPEGVPPCSADRNRRSVHRSS